LTRNAAARQGAEISNRPTTKTSVRGTSYPLPSSAESISCGISPTPSSAVWRFSGRTTFRRSYHGLNKRTESSTDRSTDARSRSIRDMVDCSSSDSRHCSH
jgi:polyisoprenoid-binding protein YceI